MRDTDNTPVAPDLVSSPTPTAPANQSLDTDSYLQQALAECDGDTEVIEEHIVRSSAGKTYVRYNPAKIKHRYMISHHTSFAAFCRSDGLNYINCISALRLRGYNIGKWKADKKRFERDTYINKVKKLAELEASDVHRDRATARNHLAHMLPDILDLGKSLIRDALQPDTKMPYRERISIYTSHLALLGIVAPQHVQMQGVIAHISDKDLLKQIRDSLAPKGDNPPDCREIEGNDAS